MREVTWTYVKTQLVEPDEREWKYMDGPSPQRPQNQIKEKYNIWHIKEGGLDGHDHEAKIKCISTAIALKHDKCF